MKGAATSWAEVSLYDVCNPKQWPTIPQTAFVDEGYPVYGANGRIGYYTEFNHEKPTVLITCRGATCGTINVCEPKSYVTGNSMALDDLDESMVRPGYLVYALRHRGLAKAITGTAQPQITRESLTAILIPLPPLPEQLRIAELLDRAEALRAKRRGALTQLDSLTQSLFLDLFGDPANNPKRMRKEPLCNLIKLKSGEFLPAAEMAESGAYPVLGGNGINGFHDRYMFEAPQIVIGRVGVYCGCVHVSPLNSWVTDNALYVSERSEDVTFDYLFHALTHARLNQYASQSGQPLISGSRIYPVQI